MGSRKEDERNEKIIRGLMKLPPNRRCINCNSLGPQYVCTTFWTFVCMTCSGIHREFTHRVKSVSMSKFSSQEVEAIQNGGNQRARDIYLKDWDFQMQRLPNNSNVDKIREFIKNVYVDRRYIGGKTSEKPPRDKQSLKIQEDETRRASSYHSYSQSPPYDHQYEDRRYGKPVAALSRKPGSDRARYEGNISSFVYSPGRLSDQMYEDRFANEGSVSRMSDYSVSSGGDPFRSEALSPNSHDTGFGSPPYSSTRDVINTTIEVNAKRDMDRVPHPKRAVSSGSVGSADSNSGSLNSTDLSGPTNGVLEPEKAARNDLDKTFAFQHLSVPESLDGVDLFQGQFVEKLVPFVASNVDLFQSAASSAPALDLFQPSLQTPTPYAPVEQPLQTSLYPSFFPEISLPLSYATSEEAPRSLGESKKEGWATFDSPHKTLVLPGIENNIPAKVNVDNSLGEFGSFSSINRDTQWLPFQNFGVQEPPLTMSTQWHSHLPSVQAPPVVNDSQSWNAFEDSTGHLPLESGQGSKIQESDVGVGVGHNSPTITTDFDMAYKILYPPMDEAQPVVANRKSTNPFDLAYDYGLEQSNMFFDMSSLQTALPNPQSTATLLGGSQPWFPQNSGSSYIPAAAQGSLNFMPGEAAGSQLPTVSAAEPVASVGGNPFA